MKNVPFSRVVSGAPSVVNAFESCQAARWWWRAILWLHGKPSEPTLDSATRCRIVADGFRFYAQLYRFLGVLFWLIGAALWWARVFETPGLTWYCTGALGLAGAFLWFASGLGFHGARALCAGQSAARLVLCTFMVSVIAFLSALTAVLSVVAQLELGSDAVLNLGSVAILWVFGLGSYLIEVLYLVAEPQLALKSPD